PSTPTYCVQRGLPKIASNAATPGFAVSSELIVIIDDSATHLKILERLANSLGGWSVAQAFNDAEAALSVGRGNRPGLIALHAATAPGPRACRRAPPGRVRAGARQVAARSRGDPADDLGDRPGRAVPAGQPPLCHVRRGAGEPADRQEPTRGAWRADSPPPDRDRSAAVGGKAGADLVGGGDRRPRRRAARATGHQPDVPRGGR